jgi:hypothetical protein
MQGLYLFILFNDAVSSWDYKASNNTRLTMNRKGYGRKLSWSNLRYYPGIAWRDWEKLEKSCQDNRSPGRDLNQRYPEYEARERRLTPRAIQQALVLPAKLSQHNYCKFQTGDMHGVACTRAICKTYADSLYRRYNHVACLSVCTCTFSAVPPSLMLLIRAKLHYAVEASSAGVSNSNRTRAKRIILKCMAGRTSFSAI